MTMTSEERREMAEQLRKHNGHYYEELVNMSDSDLADLIDPTCNLEEVRGRIPDALLDNLTTWFCSECGSPMFNDVPPSFCPFCGARFVEESGE